MKVLLLLLSIIFFNYTSSYAQDFKILSQLQLDDNAYFSTLRIDRNEYGIGILNNRGVMAKEQPINSIPIALGKMDENVLIIGAEQKKVKTIGFKAILVNKKSGSILKEQSIFKKENSNQIAASLLNDANDNFCYVLFRETKNDEGFHMFGPSLYDAKFLESSSIQLFSLNNNLEPRTIDLKTAATDSYFAGAVADENKNIYICLFTNKSMTVEKFDASGKLLNKLTTAFSVHDKNPSFTCIIKNEKNNQQSIIVTTTCNNADKKNILNEFKFDFSIDKIFTSGEITLNKEYRQSLKNTNEKADGKNFSDIENLEPVQIIEDAKRIILVKEIKTLQIGGKGEGTIYSRKRSIITVHNKTTFQVEREIVIDKKFATFVEPSHGISAYLSGDNLWVITCENSGLTSFKTYVSKINLSTGEVAKEEIEKDDIGKGWVTFPTQTAWFKKNYIVPFFKVSSPFSLSFESKFIVKPY